MEAEYRGPALLVMSGEQLDVEVNLSGRVEPIDGKYRWGGRIARHERVQDLAAGRLRELTLHTPDGYAAGGRLGEQDPWGGFRVTGVGAPPFPVPTTPDDMQAH